MAVVWRKTTTETMETFVGDTGPVPIPPVPDPPPVIDPPPIDDPDNPDEPDPPPVIPDDPVNPIPPSDLEPIPDTALWFSPTGDNAGPGNREHPWKDINFAEKIGGSFKGLAGRTLVFTDGVHWVHKHKSFVACLHMKANGMTFRAENPGQAVLKIKDVPEGGVTAEQERSAFLSLAASNLTFHGLIFDGSYHDGLGWFKNHHCTDFRMLDCEVRNMGEHAFRPNGGRNVLIERCYFHHIIKYTAGGGFGDAHALSFEKLDGISIRDCRFEQISGDAIQTQDESTNLAIIAPVGRAWPLTAEEAAAFGAESEVGVQPGENFLDTKMDRGLPYSKILVENADISGWTPGRIDNTAAFNIKENADVTLRNCKVSNSGIAFRCRGETSKGGPAKIDIIGGEISDNDWGVRYEDDIGRDLVIKGVAFRNNVNDFRKTGREDGFPIVMNCTFDGSLPIEARASEGNVLVS